MSKKGYLRLGSITAFIAFQLLFALSITPRFLRLTGGRTFLDITPLWEPQEILNYIASLSSEARQAYTTMQLVDTLYPLVYTSALLSFAPKKKIWIPIFLGMIFDYCENIMIGRLLAMRAGTLVPVLLPYCTVIKFSMIGISLGLIIIYALRRRRSAI